MASTETRKEEQVLSYSNSAWQGKVYSTVEAWQGQYCQVCLVYNSVPILSLKALQLELAQLVETIELDSPELI